MKLRVLVAEPHDVLRMGLRTIFSEDPRVSNVYLVSNSRDLADCLNSNLLDLAIVNQSLILDIDKLPQGHYVLLADEPNLTMIKAVYKHGAKGYLSEKASAELLRAMLSPENDIGMFLIDPFFAPRVMEHLLGNPGSEVNDKLLTAREREIITLLRDGMDRPTIAKKLCITEATLKTHIKNISRKKEKEPIGAINAR